MKKIKEFNNRQKLAINSINYETSPIRRGSIYTGIGETNGHAFYMLYIHINTVYIHIWYI